MSTLCAGVEALRHAERAVWLPPGSWVDTASGVEIRAPSGGAEVVRASTLWEVPVFARAGSMLPLAPPPGLTADGVGGGVGGGANAEFQPALGMAQVMG